MYIRFLFIFSILFALSGCSIFDNLYARQDVVKNRDKDYLKAENSQSLKMPSGVQLENSNPAYPIPSVKATQVGFTDDALQPPGSEVAQKARQARVANLLKATDETALSYDVEQNDNGSYSLNIDQTGSGAWNAIGLALLTANYSVIRQDRVYGIYYVVYEGNNDLIDDTLLYGVKLSNSGLFDLGGVSVNLTDEKGQRIAPELEKIMLDNLADNLANLVTADKADAQPRVSLLTRDIDGNPQLLLNRGKVQSWSNVDIALVHSGYSIIRRNEESTVFYVAVPSRGAKVTASSALYGVYIRTHGGVTRVLVINEDLNLPTYDQANAVLTKIQKNLR